MMAEEKEGLEEESGWVPELLRADPNSKDGDVPPEMTNAMGSLATFLGDDRVVKEDELDYDDELPDDSAFAVDGVSNDWEDPFGEVSFPMQLYEESKLVDWPGPLEVAKQLLLTNVAIVAVSLMIYTIDKYGIEFGKTIFVYGVNPDATNSLF